MERNTQHTNTTDLLAWPENTPAPSSPPTTASRSHQFGGQVTDEEFESLNKRKPCSGSGIFTGNGENEESDPTNANPTPNSKTGIRMYQPAGGQVSGEEEQTQAPSPPPAAKPQSQPVSGSEEEEQQPQPVAPPPTQATTSKKRKSCGREKDDSDFALAQLQDTISRKKRNQMDIDVERLAGSKKKVKFDGSSLCGIMTMMDSVIKEALELLSDEKRGEVKESLNKLLARANKWLARANKLQVELVAERLNLMDCSLSHDESSAIAQAIAEAEAEAEADSDSDSDSDEDEEF